MKGFFHFFVILIVLLLSATNCYAEQGRAVQSIPGGLDMSTTNVPATFSASNPGSRVLSGLVGFTHIMVVTDSTTCVFEINTTHDAVAPTSDNIGSFILDPSVFPGVILDGPVIAGSVYVRSIGGACTADTLWISVW